MLSETTRLMLMQYRAESYARGGMIEDLINNLVHDIKKLHNKHEQLIKDHNMLLLKRKEVTPCT